MLKRDSEGNAAFSEDVLLTAAGALIIEAILGPRDVGVLLALVEANGNILSSQQIADRVGCSDVSIRSSLQNVRKALLPDYIIENKQRQGWCFKKKTNA